jgi:hypothetical protein
MGEHGFDLVSLHFQRSSSIAHEWTACCAWRSRKYIACQWGVLLVGLPVGLKGTNVLVPGASIAKVETDVNTQDQAVFSWDSRDNAIKWEIAGGRLSHLGGSIAETASRLLTATSGLASHLRVFSQYAAVFNPRRRAAQWRKLRQAPSFGQKLGAFLFVS